MTPYAVAFEATKNQFEEFVLEIYYNQLILIL